MARPLSVGKRIKQLVNDVLADYFGYGRPAQRKGKPPADRRSLEKLTQAGRARVERPTRDFDNFAYIQDVLANMPAATAALRQLSEDVALDEDGDPRAWQLVVKADPIDDDASADSTKQLREFKDRCQKIFDEWAERTGIGYNAKIYTYKFVSAGDCFAEQAVSLSSETGLGRIERIRELPTWQMRPIWDNGGDLTAYEQWLTVGYSEANVRWDVPAQIIHWKYHPTDYIPYGESVFAPLRGRWEQFKLVELDTIAAVHTKSVDPEIHLLGMKEPGERLSDEQIEKYKQDLLDNPTDINRFYVGRQGEVEILLPRAGSADSVRSLIDAHRDLEDRFVECLGVDRKSGNPFDAKRRAGATAISQKYARRVSSIRQDFAYFLKPAVMLEFALQGIDISKPEQYGARYISLDVIWPDISESRLQRSTRLLSEWTSGLISHETALRESGRNSPESEWALIKREREEGDMPLAALAAQKQAEATANGSQGRGVPKDEGSQTQTESIDSERLRELIREELVDLVAENLL